MQNHEHASRMPIRNALLLLAAFTLCVGPTLAEEEPEPWEPTVPAMPAMPTEWDWIQLTSDEWLKGEFIVMFKEQLEFESDELDMLTFDWEDIAQVRTASIMQVRFLNNEIVTGKLYIEGEAVQIITEKGVRDFTKSEILSVTAGVPREINFWSGKVTIGANIRSGNTEQKEINTQARFQRRTVMNRINLDFIGNYNITDDVEAADNQRASGTWDKFISDRLFVTPVFAEYYRDPFQNIEQRWTLGAGVGYDLIDNNKMELSASGGPAYQKTTFSDVEVDSSDSESTPALVLGSMFDWDITGDIDFIWEYRLQITNEETGTYNHHMVTKLEIELTSMLDVDFSWVWDRIQDPRPDSDGDVPEQDDYRLTVGIGFEF
jgi:putative salt-induced outer membrane protein YdiY